LLTLVDDATGRTLGRFGAQETIASPPAALRGLRAAADHPWRQGFKHMGRDVPYWQLVK
jgi:hypothetical protein